MSSNSESQDNGVSNGATIIAIVGSFTGASAVFVAARLFVRIKLTQNLGLDDHLIVLAMVCAFVNLGISSAAAESGSGRHFDTLSLEQQQNVIKFTIAAFCPGILSFAIPKLAVVALLTKLMNPSPAHRMFLWISSGVTTIVLFGCVVILYAQCTPSRSQWDFSVQGECWSVWILVNYAIFSGALSAFMDLYLAVYPAVVLAKLQMNVKKKIALAVALGIGSVACIVAAYKCTRIPGLASDDFSYNTANLVIWTSVEGSTIIIASCIPILQPLVKLIFSKDALSSARRTSEYPNGTPYYKSSHGTDIALSDDPLKRKAIARTKMGITHPTEVDSQERILHKEESGDQIPVQSSRRQSSVQAAITRTDEVTVSFSPKAGASESFASSRW